MCLNRNVGYAMGISGVALNLENFENWGVGSHGTQLCNYGTHYTYPLLAGPQIIFAKSLRSLCTTAIFKLDFYGCVTK